MDRHQWAVPFNGKEWDCYYIKDKEEAIQFIDILMGVDEVMGIDIETARLPEYRFMNDAAFSEYTSRPRLIQIATSTEGVVFDCFSIDDYSIFIDLLMKKKWVAHNAKFELKFFKSIGLNHHIDIECTMNTAKLICHAMYDNDASISYSLGAVVDLFLGKHILKNQGDSDWGLPNLTFEQLEYAIIDSIVVVELLPILLEKANRLKLDKMNTLYKGALHGIVDLEHNGLILDKQIHRQAINTWREEVYKYKIDVMNHTGLEDVTGPKVSNYLSKNLSASDKKNWDKTTTGKLATSKEALEKFAHLPVVRPFINYNKAKTKCSTFGESLITLINKRSGRLHGNFLLNGARTGRLACREPNMQNFPRSPKEDSGEVDIRKAFIAGEGNILICADYSQIEIRVAAELSQDRVMLDAYRKGVDLHALTASVLLNRDIKYVTKDDRQLAKAFNFGLLFGIGPAKFSAYAFNSYGVVVTEEEAREYIEAFRRLYPDFRQWQINTTERAKVRPYSRTPLGKLRKLDPDNYYGASLNTPIQGGASEVMLKALHELSVVFMESDVKLINCVHDEILIECPKEFEEDVMKITEDVMVSAYKFVFPKGVTIDLVGISSGLSWADAK